MLRATVGCRPCWRRCPRSSARSVLRLIVGLSADETAVAVDSTAGAVRVAQHRALTKLRGELTNHRDKTYQDQKEQR